MVKDKDIRPTRARIIGNLIPNHAKLLEECSYQNFHVKRTTGTNVTYKNMSVITQNLNDNWIDTELHITELPTFTWGVQDGIVFRLVNSNGGTGLANERVTVTIGDTVQTTNTNDNGFGAVYFTPPSPGTYTIVVRYDGNNRKSYKACSVQYTFTVAKANVIITASDKTGTVGQQISIPVTVKNSSTQEAPHLGAIQLYAGDELLDSITTSTGSVTFTRTWTSEGVYNLTVKYHQNNYYNEKTKNITVTVNRRGTKLVVSPTSFDVYVNENATISVQAMYSDDTAITSGTLELYEGNTLLTTKAISGNSTNITYTPTSVGTKSLQVKLKETNKYSSSTKNVTATVTKKPTKLVISPTSFDVYVNESYTIAVQALYSNDNTPITSGTLELYEGNTLVKTKAISGNSTNIVYTPTSVGSKSLEVKLVATNNYNAATKSLTASVSKKTTYLSGSASFTCEVDSSNTLSIRAKYNHDNSSITSGTLELYEDGTLKTTKTITGATTNIPYTPTSTGSKSLEVKLVATDNYKAATKSLTATVTKIATTVSITVNDFYDWPIADESFNVQVKDSGNNRVDVGSVTLKFVQEQIEEEENVATFNLANTTGNITCNRKNLNLDTLYSTISARKYLYYTGYKVVATYTGNAKYANSTGTAKPINIHAYKSIIVPVVVINQNNDYNIEQEYPRVPTDANSLARLHIRVAHNPDDMYYGAFLVQNNSTRPLSSINMGTVSRGDIIWFATEFLATHVPDSQKNLSESNWNNIDMVGVGGINYEVHYKINNDTEEDTAEAQINGGSSRYTIPRYTKFTVPNYVSAGDTLQIIFYTGINEGYYNMYDNTYGFRYVFEFEVI